jgi:hypothetical protein
MPSDQLSCALWADTGGAGQFVRGVAAERNEVRNLLWVNAISLANLVGPDTRNFAAPRRIQDGCGRRGQLKGIPIAACDYRGAARALFCCNRGGEKVVRFVDWGFCVRKPEGGDKFRQDIQLLNQISIELSATLVGGRLTKGA